MKVKANFIEERIVNNDKGTHCFLKFSSAELGLFEIYLNEPLHGRYLEEYLLNFEIKVRNSKLQVVLNDYKKVS